MPPPDPPYVRFRKWDHKAVIVDVAGLKG
jgi:hypothetical protein